MQPSQKSTNLIEAGSGIADHRASYAREEVLGVLEHYPIGSIQSVREMLAGSIDSPKAVIECDRGKLLLKRRARGLEHATLVGYAHEVIIGCLERGVCVPPLIGTSTKNNSMCQIGDKTYELFVFIEGTGFDQSIGHARQAGMLLGELHKAMDTLATSFEATVETCVVNPERAMAARLNDQTQRVVQRIMEYGLDAHRANAREPAIIHGDWHPGNMIFDGDEIIAICDFDNCRLGSRDRELAQALIYLSMQRPKGESVPVEASVDHLVSVWDGYRSVPGLAEPNPRLIASLMPAVLLDEAFSGGNGGHSSALTQAAIAKSVWLDEQCREIERRLG